MKISIDVECTPEEARAFLGLPDVGPMQEALLESLRERLQANIEEMDAEALMKAWLPASVKGWEELMKSFWGQAGAARPSGGKSGGERGGDA
mgnify:FL=1|jgi:hypothetical protein